MLPHRLRFDVQEVPGRVSNPLASPGAATALGADIDDIFATYVSGTSIDTLARSHGVHRTTIISHLDQRGVPVAAW